MLGLALASGCVAGEGALVPAGPDLQKRVQALRAENEKLNKEVVDAHRRLFAALQGEAKAVELANGLASPHAGVRAAAADEAGAAGLKQVAPALRERLKDASPEVRVAAANALGLLGDAASAEGLVGLLGDAPAVRIAAAAALGKLKSGMAVDPLCQLAKSGDDATVQASIDALGEIGDPRAVRPLLAQLKAGSAKVREAAARSLGPIAAQSDDAVRMAAVSGLSAAIGDTDERVRWYVVHSLAQLDAVRAEAALITRLADKSPRVREEAASALGAIGSVPAREPLLALLGDKDARVEKQAADALMSIAAKHPDAARALADQFAKRGDYPRATQLWQKLLAGADGGPQARVLRVKLADAYEAQGDWPQVVVQLAAAEKIKNGEPKIVRRLALAHLKLKAYAPAADAMADYLRATKAPSQVDWRTAAEIARGLADANQADAAHAFIAKLRKVDAKLGGQTRAALEAIEAALAPKPAAKKPAPKPEAAPAEAKTPPIANGAK